MFSFDSGFIKTDVTAVKCFKEHYLIGVGGYVYVFDKYSKFITKINVFEGQKIYNIIPNNDESNILIYGGRYLKIIALDKDFTQTNEPTNKITSDWILAAKWIDKDQVATVSMHNKLQIWNHSLDLITEVKCEEKCILYSACICYETFKELVILSGTVFSEVLVWRPTIEKESPVLKRLQRHKGVIFSVHYNDVSNYICSSSDDRSSVLWKPKNKSLLTELQSENIEINVACHVFGHLSRVFKCHVLNECFLTAGEDSFLNVWSFNGTLIRKIETHQGGPIWAVDTNKDANIILTGGSDCAATLFPINCNFEESQLSIPNKDVPKIVCTLANNNLVVFSEHGIFFHYIKKNRTWIQVQKHNDLRSYVLVVVSKCKNLVALAGFEGQIYVYKQINDNLCQLISSKTRNKSRIFALHWINCSTFLVCQTEGKITLYFLNDDKILPVTNFVLPQSKERWSTTALFNGKHFVIGDRKGNLHLFELGKLEPIQTLKRVHSHLGATNLLEKNGAVLSLGRNSILKTFCLNSGVLELTSSNKLPFTWLVDIIEDLLLAFSGDKFVLWNHKNKRVIFEKSCGGGHRSWDFLKIDNHVQFVYIKDKRIHVVELNLNDFSPTDLIEGYQVKEINSVETINILNNYIVVSGGEDTTLRINLSKGANFTSLLSFKSHLSSIRSITTYKLHDNDKVKETYLVFSGGGRAQIICWKLEVFMEGKALKNVCCSEQHSYYKIIDSEESEMRIMDLTVTSTQNKLMLFAACSDGHIKTFFVKIDNSGRYHLSFHRDVFYKQRCIIKLCNMDVFSRNVVVTMATDGRLVFWDMSDICKDDSDVKHFATIQAHQSGINSYDFLVLEDNTGLFLTGGDDNAIVLNLIRLRNSDTVTIQRLDTFVDTGTHCAQITGAFLSGQYFLTASIDQRIALFKWTLLNEKITCTYITKYNTAVADLQGLCCFEREDFDVFIYGKGIEYIKIRRKSDSC